jgi:hypothetical protein
MLTELTEVELNAVSGGWGFTGGLGERIGNFFQAVVDTLNPESEFTHQAAADPYNPTTKANPFGSGK